MPTKPSVSISLVSLLIKVASGMGLALEPVLKLAGLSAETLQDPEARISARQFNKLWSDVSQRTGDPYFGLHFAETASQYTGNSILFTVMMNCANLRGALEKQARYHSLVTDFVRLYFEEHGQQTYYVWECAEGQVLERQYTEAVFYGLVFSLRRLTGGTVQPSAINFKHAQPEDLSEHQKVFGCPLVFGCPQNALVINNQDLDHAVWLANPKVLGQLEKIAQEMLEKISPPDTWTGKVAGQIQKSFEQGEKPSLEQTARALAFSQRQLQNKLAGENTRYQIVLDQVRQKLALDYLKAAQLPGCDIAFLLGFSEQSVFNHAFKRWTGLTPGEFRRREAG
jgi:AraC-like DNA-binding protein